MAVNIAKERWTSSVRELVLGTEPNQVKVGGESALPFLHFEGKIPNRPVYALEVFDMEPSDWPETLTSAWDGVLGDPVAWAKKCEEYGADLVCLRLASANPDDKNASAEEVAETAKKVAEAVSLPLVIIGCGVEEKDGEILPVVGEALSQKNYLLGCATENNYKSITATCMVHGHNIIASSPLDINLAKQLNILITEMNLKPEHIAIDPLVGALGYGIEYAYSIIERARIGALMGDKMLAMPVICFVGQEAWKTKESKTPTNEEWGDGAKRGLLWEIVTATTFIHAGGSIIILRHPESLKQVKAHVEKMMEPVAY